MKKIIQKLANKAICAAFVVLGAFAASAELVKEPILNDGVSVGYKVIGLENGEVAMVYTNHLKTATWTVPYDIENVQFLVVGGGGGGGGAASYLPNNSAYEVHHGSRGGAGGGGGGVVTGLVNFVSGDKLSIKIGKGGTGGIYSNSDSSGTGAAKADEEATTVKVGGIEYIKAGAGGSDNGYQKTGGQGASNSGSRNNTVSAIKTDVFYVNSQFISIFKTYGHKGGMGNYNATSQSGGGGGGAGGSGKPEVYSRDADASGGDGGKGLELNITGEQVVYGAGGGGGSGYKGNGGKGGNGVLNSGAGNGGSKPATTNYSSIKNNGSSALANQGGGGGGAGYRGDGGNGGSGIVVLRYVEKLAPEKPVVDNLTYTGSELVGVSGDGFTVVSGTVAATEVGTYTAVLSPEGGVWADGTTGDYEVTWKILPIMTGLDINENDGYIVRGLGDGNEVAVVFTNENADAINWTVPTALNNAQFLVVGGGGGGGADNSADSNERIAGAGGGGGGVVTGLVNFDRDTIVSVTVGAGGLGGKMSVDASGDSGYGGAYNGEASIFGVNGIAWVTADGGGSDQGASANNSYLGGKDGSAGGSGAGGRANANGGAETQGDVNSVNVTSSHKYGFPGGNGCTVANGGYGYGAAGGGGGATAAGSDGTKVDAYKGGDGGAGLTSDITGVAKVYGSGGGGSSTWDSAGIGGEGAGDGVVEGNGKNALANQGGGGGGSSRKAATGGNGGSGIVVFRFEYSDTAVASVNGYGYSNIAEAINAANGGTVTLVANVESMTLNNSLTLKTDVYSVNTVTIANENAVLTTDKKLNVVSSVEDYEVVETVEDGVYTYSLEVVISTYTITLPEVIGAKWYYGDNAVVGNTITVESGTDVTLTLKADSGYAFENGEASITVNIGNVTADVVVNDSQYVAPSEKVASGKITSVMKAYSDGRERIGIEFKVSDVKDLSTLYFELYDEEMNVLIRTSYFGASLNPSSCNIVLNGSASSSWKTEILTTLTIDNIPAVVKMFADGVCLVTDVRPLSSLDTYLNFDCVLKEEPDAVVASDTWGGIDWTLTEKGVLTIKPTTGTPVPDVNAPTKRTYEVGEWRETVIYNSKGVGIEIGGTPYDMKAVKKLVIEEGVTMIGSFTCQFPNLTGEVVIPSTVAYIGQEAFHKTPITTLTFAEGGTAPLCIANGAFKKILIEEVSLPKDREYIHVHHWAFGGCPNLKRAFIPGNITKVWGGEHVDYLSNFEAQTNVTWAEYGSLFTGCTQMESITFETEEARDLFFSNNRNSSDKDYIVAYAGLKAYNSLRAAFDAAEDGDKVGPVMNITLKDEWIGDNSAFFTIKDKNIVFDLGGRTISWKGSDEISLSAVFAVEGTSSLTLIDELNKNWKYRGAGTISVTSNGAQVFSLLAAKGNDSVLTVNGGTYTLNTAMDSLVYSENAKTVINAGTFKLVNAASGVKIINTLGENQLQVVVNGGTYNADLNSQELVGEVAIDKDRFACKDNGDGTWSVLSAVAYIAGGSVSYATLEDAFKAVKAGDTIEILDDVTVTEPWNCSEAGARFTVPVTINGNGKTITFTNVVDDGVTNMAALCFETDAVVRDLTIVMGETTTVYSLRSRMVSTKSAISAKGNLMVDNCAFVGSGDNANAIVYGDGTDGSEGVTVTISNSSFTGWDRGVTANGSDNEVGTVVLDGNTFEGSDVHISASENVTFNNNKMEEGWVDITSYTAQETFMVKATGNDLVANGNGNENRVNAKNVEIQDGFLLPVAEIDGEKYFALQAAVDAAFGGATVKLLADVVLDGTVKVLAENKLVLDLNGKTIDGTGKVRIAIMSYGDLTIKDSSEEKTGVIKAGIDTAGNCVNICAGSFTLESGNIYSLNNGILIDEEAATVTVNGGKITAEPGTNNSAAFYISSASETIVNIAGGELVGYNGILLWNNTKLNITGGSIDAKGRLAIQGNGSRDNTEIAISGNAKITGREAAIYHPQGGKLTISGGEVTGETGVIVKGGNVTISGGTITATGAAGAYEPVSSGFKGTGDALYVEHYDNSPNSENYGTPTVTITGGTFVSANGQAVASYANPNGDVEALEKFISGGTFATKPNADYCALGYAPVEVNGGYSVAVLPDAEVTNLGSITVGLGDYKADAYMMYDIINGGKLQEATVPYDLTLAMDFKAKDTAETAAQNAFGNYTTDFFITMSGMSQASFVGDGCYLAGYYPSFKAWVKIPLDGFTVENGKTYPVITSAGQFFTYADICGTVGEFICGIYLTPEVLAANPNLTVELTLGLSENNAAALNADFTKVDSYLYTSDELMPSDLPEVEITDIKDTLTENDPDLTFALNFKIKDLENLPAEYLDKLIERYGDYYTDYVLTISGLTDPNGSVTFNADGTGDGYLAGQYDAWNANWVTVPFEDVTIKNGESLYIMECAGRITGQSGLRVTLREVAQIIKDFDCGVYFTPEFLLANPNLEVKLELKVFTEDEEGNKTDDISVATNMFDKDDFSVKAAKLYIRIVNGKPQIGYEGEGTLVLNAAANLTGEWIKKIPYTIVENDGDDAKTWVTPAEGYFFFKGFIVK